MKMESQSNDAQWKRFLLALTRRPGPRPLTTTRMNVTPFAVALCSEKQTRKIGGQRSKQPQIAPAATRCEDSQTMKLN